MKTKQKSLTQLAEELGVSASYLSQVRHGKRPASDRLINALKNLSVKQSVKQYGKILSDSVFGEVPELADGHGLGPCAFGRGGSSPPFPIKVKVLAGTLTRTSPASISSYL
jgi:transcriptional regulator with XRE-family HTH domain